MQLSSSAGAARYPSLALTAVARSIHLNSSHVAAREERGG